MVKDEFDRIYTTAGGSGMNAGTSNDFTVYFINVPANKLELWFWMESDRLRNPVFREFYSERDVVHEERRLRTDSTPTGKFNEQYDSMFWQSSPYGWPVVGWPSDLEGITREEALEYFAVNYAPNNLTACLVGDIDPARGHGTGASNTSDVCRVAHARRNRCARARCRSSPRSAWSLTRRPVPQVRVRYHTVAEGHPDDFVLDILGSVLSGRTGRLYKSLVLQQQVANSASAGQDWRKYEGLFELSGVAKPGKTPEEVEQALYKEIERLQKELVDAKELQKVKNQYAAGNFRGICNQLRLDGPTAACATRIAAGRRSTPIRRVIRPSLRKTFAASPTPTSNPRIAPSPSTTRRRRARGDARQTLRCRSDRSGENADQPDEGHARAGQTRTDQDDAGAYRATGSVSSRRQTELYQGGQKDAGRSPQATRRR